MQLIIYTCLSVLKCIPQSSYEIINHHSFLLSAQLCFWTVSVKWEEQPHGLWPEVAYFIIVFHARLKNEKCPTVKMRMSAYIQVNVRAGCCMFACLFGDFVLTGAGLLIIFVVLASGRDRGAVQSSCWSCRCSQCAGSTKPQLMSWSLC